MSLILAISTSSKAASVSLIKSGSMLAEPISFDGNSHTQTLAPMIDELFSSFSISCNDIDCFAVDTGPGSFTGVRIGVATANGLALGSGKPVLGISSLLALRYQQPDISPIVTVIDAHNNNVYAAVYYNKQNFLPPVAMTVDELIEKIPANALCVGDGALFHQQLIAETHPTAKFSTDESGIIHASGIGLAAWDMIAADPEILKRPLEFVLPTYLKESQAERQKNNN